MVSIQIKFTLQIFCSNTLLYKCKLKQVNLHNYFDFRFALHVDGFSELYRPLGHSIFFYLNKSAIQRYMIHIML